MRNTAKTLMVVVASAPLALATVGAAHAGKPVTYDYSYVNATLVHVGQIDGFDGNAHLVDVWGGTEGYADAYVTSFDCVDGALPSYDDEGEGGCEYLSSLDMSGSVAVELDPDLTLGSISGALTAYEYDWETDEVIELGSYDIDLSVTGTGDVVTESWGSKKEKEYGTSSSRSGTAGGSLGPFDFAGATGSLVNATETYRDSNKYRERYSGEEVFLHWIELGELPGGVAGNAHVGQMWASTDGWADGQVVDWTCPEGELPPVGGGGHGEEFEEEPETNCVQESVRFVWADGTLDVTMDKKLTKATLVGSLNVEDHDTGAGGTPAANIVVTGEGAISTNSYRSKWDEEWGSGSERFSSSTRSGTVDGFIGAMGFADDADDISTAEMSRYKGMYRESWN